MTTPDERVRLLVLDVVRGNVDSGRLSLWADDGNDISWNPQYKPEFAHVRRCGTLYLENVKTDGVETGYCQTCADWEVGLRFDAACTCGYRQPGLVWIAYGRDSGDDLTEMYNSMAKY